MQRIDNSSANKLFNDAKNGINLQAFMDVISGITNYKVRDHRRQGFIRSSFAKELISSQFLIEIDDIISIFWGGVFEHLDKAKFYGEDVEIKASGANKEVRPTNNNPINYLRYHGKMAVRNYLSQMYHKNLEQGCTNCGYHSSIRNNKKCPGCNSVMITTYKFADLETKHDNLLISSRSNIEDKDVMYKIYMLLNDFAEDELKQGTRAYQILKILTEPRESVEMCGSCKLCESRVFDIDSCTNYNANIGRWLGVNKTMIASKVKRIRGALPKWLFDNASDEAEYFLEIIPQKFKALSDV